MSMKAVCFVAALCVFATLTVQASEVTAKGIDVKKAVDAGWTPAPVAEFAQLRWASEKEKFNKNHANQLVPFGAYRTVYVANLLRKIVKDMGIHGEEIMVNAMGSTNPTSDYDVTIDHHRADELATRFNSEFEGAWGETSADVFDTNIYPVGWVLDKRAWQNRVPFCTHPLADTAKHAAGSNDVTVRGYEEFKPAAEFANMRKKFENATVIWGLVKAQYQINVLGAEMFKDHVAGVNCHAKQAPVVSRGMCMLMHYFRTTALNNINWRNVGAPVEAADAGAGSLLSTPLYHRGKTIIGEIMTSSVQKLHTLMTTPCSEDPAFNRTCCYSYYSSDRKKYESAIHMNNMKCRNRMYEKWAKKVYDKLRTAGRCTFDAWFDLVEDIRVAEFYGAETYYTEGAFFKTVLAEQALVPSLLKDNPALERFKGLKITRLEIVSSVLENFADFVKELGHSVHEHWNQTETVVQASKYMKRLLTASRDLIDTSPGADAAGTALHEELANILKKSSKPTEDLAGKIRGKAMTPELIAIRDQNVQILEAVYNDLAGNYRAVINSKNPERTHIPSWYRASMALTARMLDYFIIVNESNPAYHASYVMYDGTQHNGPAHSSSSSSSSSSAKAPAAAASPSAPAAKKRAARFAHKRLQPHF